MNNEDIHPPSFTEISFETENAIGSVKNTHDPVSELKDIYERIENQIDELRNNKNPKALETVVDETTLPRELRQEIVALYTLSVGLIEAYSAQILIRDFVDSEFKDSGKMRKFFERDMSVSYMIRMLQYFGVINKGLHGEIQKVIDLRNSYVHQHEESMSIGDYNEFFNNSRKCVRSVKKLAIELDGKDHRNWSI